MAEEVIAQPAPEVDESFIEYFNKANAADRAVARGEAPPAIEPAPEAPEDIPEDDLEPAPVEKEPEPAKKVDGRTLEGRRQKLYQQVEELTTQRHQTKREVEEARAEVAQLRAEIARLAPPQRQPQASPQQHVGPPQDDPEPKIEDFAKLQDGSDNPDPYTSWLRQTQRWEARQAARETQQQFVARSEAAQVYQSWESKINDAEKATPGFREKLRTATVPIHRDIIPHIQRHEMGAQIANYLIDHADIAQRLTTLHPVEQIGQIGEIVGELKAQAQAAKSGSAAPAKPVSSARAPIQPLGTSPIASSESPGDEESVESHFRRENALDRKRGRR